MDEAKDKKEAHVEALLIEAITLNLYGVEDILDIPVSETARFYNGCGPEWLNADIRERLTEFFAIFEPGFMIHDFRFEKSDGTRCGFNAANLELEHNLKRIAKAEYGFFNRRRYLALAAVRVIVEACSRYGWSAWCKGVDSPTHTPSRSPAKLPLLLCALCVSAGLTGCYRSIELIREGEYSLTYTAVGLKTDVSKIEAEKTTNGTVRVFIEGVATDVSERNAKIIESSGTAVGNIAKEVVEGLK